MKKVILYLAISFLALPGVLSQVYNRNNLYFEEYYVLNPASVMENQSFRASFGSHLSNMGFPDAPRTLGFRVYGPLSEKMGLGLRVMTDSRGSFQNNQLLASYAYTLKFGSDHVLSMGLSAGIYAQKLDVGNIDAMQTEDEILQSDNNKKHYFMNEFGLDYVWKDLQVGIAAPNVLQLYNHYLAYAQYNYAIPGFEDMTLIPLILYQHLPEYKNQLDAGLKVLYKSIWISYIYRTNKDMLVALGLHYERYRLSYSFGINNQDLSSIASGSHEIMLTYDFNLSFTPRKASYNKDKMPWQEE